MKAIVVEIRKKSAAVLSEEGFMTRIKNRNYKIGQEVEINMRTEFKFKKAASLAAAVACMMLVIGGGSFAYYSPSTYVSLDINPSIEYRVNMFNRVISANAANNDGTEILEEIGTNNLKNKTITEAVEMTLDQICEEGYLDSDDGGVVITASHKNMEKAKNTIQTLEKTANKSLEKNNREAVVAAEAVGQELVREAAELGVTPGKLNLIRKMMECVPDSDNIDMQEWLGKSVREIMAQTNQYMEQNRNQTQEQIQNQEQIQDGTQEQIQEQIQNGAQEQAQDGSQNIEQNPNETGTSAPKTHSNK